MLEHIIKDFFKEVIVKMRYREEVLDSLYPNYDLSNYYILWLDFDILFPYAFNNASTTIRLNGPNIIHNEINKAEYFLLRDVKNANLVKNGDWYSISKDGYFKGIPYFFENFEQLSQVNQVLGYVEFNYVNMYMEKSKCVVCMSQNVAFEKIQDRKDYTVKLKGTIIPTLLEKIYDEERKEIISKFENVIQASAYQNENTIHSNAIKITTENIALNREDIISSIYSWINNGSKVRQNTFLHMYINQDIYIQKPLNNCVDLSKLI